MKVVLAILAMLAGFGCGGPGAARPGGQCHADPAPPNLVESRALPTGAAGGANAWFEARVTRAEPDVANNRLFLDALEIPIVRVKSPNAEASFDPTAGQLTPRGSPKGSSADYPYVVGFRIPPGTPPGKHQLRFEACGVAATEHVTIEVLPAPAPVIASIQVVRGEQWPMLFIKGSNLSDAEEVVLVGGDDAIRSIPHVTRIDDGQIRVPLDQLGAYEVYVRTKNGLGGGVPNGVVTVR